MIRNQVKFLPWDRDVGDKEGLNWAAKYLEGMSPFGKGRLMAGDASLPGKHQGWRRKAGMEERQGQSLL